MTGLETIPALSAFAAIVRRLRQLDQSQENAEDIKIVNTWMVYNAVLIHSLLVCMTLLLNKKFLSIMKQLVKARWADIAADSDLMEDLTFENLKDVNKTTNDVFKDIKKTVKILD